MSTPTFTANHERLLMAGLVEMRKMQRIPRRQVAEALGVTVRDVRRIEKTRDPRMSTLRRYLGAIGIQVSHDVVSELDIADELDWLGEWGGRKA